MEVKIITGIRLPEKITNRYESFEEYYRMAEKLNVEGFFSSMKIEQLLKVNSYVNDDKMKLYYLRLFTGIKFDSLSFLHQSMFNGYDVFTKVDTIKTDIATSNNLDKVDYFYSHDKNNLLFSKKNIMYVLTDLLKTIKKTINKYEELFELLNFTDIIIYSEETELKSNYKIKTLEDIEKEII